MNAGKRILQISEWSTLTEHNISEPQRQAVDKAATSWQRKNNLPHPPLWFSGPDGHILNARQYVGVVEVTGITIEIYPKLDRRILTYGPITDPSAASAVMDSLIWVLDVAKYIDINEADKAALRDIPANFIDLFAILFGRHLLTELRVGLPRAYIRQEDDLRLVRGQILFLDQITRNLNRSDLMSCAWDEFTVDTTINRILKCASRFLIERVRNFTVRRLLESCVVYFDEVTDIDPITAIHKAQHVRWDRTNDRLETVFNLAHLMLSGSAPTLKSGDTSTFVFLLDMNKVFERYCWSILRTAFQVPVSFQKNVGRLFPILPKGGIIQIVDFFWIAEDNNVYVADAKYKQITKGIVESLQLSNIEAEEEGKFAGYILNANDVRQLTVYAELACKQLSLDSPPNILLMYPHDESGKFETSSTEAWNNSQFTLLPVKMTRQPSVADTIPKQDP